MSRRAAIVAITCFTGLLVIATTAKGASVSTLKHRQVQQVRSLHRHEGTVRFFQRHSFLLQPRVTPPRVVSIARRELKHARVWVRVLRHELAETRAGLRTHNRRSVMSVPQIICAVFGPECGRALSVAACESRYNVGASNGRYRGVFQLGSAERARFGGSSLDPWDQVRAAYAYWRVAGWAPWQCA